MNRLIVYYWPTDIGWHFRVCEIDDEAADVIRCYSEEPAATLVETAEIVYSHVDPSDVVLWACTNPDVRP